MKVCETLKSDVDQINVSRSQMESGRTQLGICESEQVASPIYKTVEEVRYGLKTTSVIAQPVIFKDDDLMMVI